MSAPDLFAPGGRAVDPLIALGAEWLDVCSRLNDSQNGHEERDQADVRRLRELEKQIGALVPISAAGAIVQMRVLRDHLVGADFREVCENLTENVIAGLERLIGPHDGIIDPKISGTWITQPDGSRWVYVRRS